MGARNQEQTRGRIGPQLRLGNLRVGELHFCPLCTALDQASSLSRKLAYVPGPTFGFVKPLASSGSHCTKWADEQHRQAGFESRLVPDLPLPFIPTLIGLRALTLCQVVSGGRQRQIKIKDVPKFISRARNYPVILFTFAVFNNLFWSCCICFRWPNLRKSFLNLTIYINFIWYIFLFSINRFHVDFNPYITFTPLAYMILSILTVVCLLIPFIPL